MQHKLLKLYDRSFLRSPVSLSNHRIVICFVGDNAYHCERCSLQTTATLSPRLNRLPRFLIVTLKRFLHAKTAGDTAKITTHVQFPVEKLELQRYFVSSQVARVAEAEAEASSYRLVGVVNHIGSSLRSGHYTAFCRSGAQHTSDERSESEWLKFNDEKVTVVRPADIVTATAYILLYELVDS